VRQYGLSGEDKAVRGGQCSGYLCFAGGVISKEGRKSEKKRVERKKSIIWNGPRYGYGSRCEDEMCTVLTAEANKAKPTLFGEFVTRVRRSDRKIKQNKINIRKNEKNDRRSPKVE
jgi:hypothetical protein